MHVPKTLKTTSKSVERELYGQNCSQRDKLSVKILVEMVVWKLFIKLSVFPANTMT